MDRVKHIQQVRAEVWEGRAFENDGQLKYNDTLRVSHTRREAVRIRNHDVATIPQEFGLWTDAETT